MSYSDSVETKQKSSKAPQYTSHVATRVGGGKQWLVQNTVSTNCGVEASRSNTAYSLLRVCQTL